MRKDTLLVRFRLGHGCTVYLSWLLILWTLVFSPSVHAQLRQINVYNWSDYLAPDTISGFEEKTGIQVNYDVYDRDDTLQAKLLVGGSGYDIVVPTSNYAGRQIASGLFQPLDKSKIPNLRYLDPKLMQLLERVDPGNRYLVPWAYATTGIGYNLTRVKKILGEQAPLDSLEILLNPKYISQLKQCGVSMLDDPDQVLAMVLNYLGRDPNSTDPADYDLAFEALKKIRPYIAQFSASGYINDLASGDICLAIGWSGDVTIAKHRAIEAHKDYEIRYFIPREGGPAWFDVMAIPKDARNVAAAHEWINYIETPQVHAAITNSVFYPSANLASRRFVLPGIAADPAVYPPETVLKTLFTQEVLPPSIARLKTRLWMRLKAFF